MRSDAAAPGGGARTPAEVPARGWREIVVRAWRESTADNVGMLAGGVAFFAFLALFPALIALLTVYGLAVSPEQARAQVTELAMILPAEAQPLITDQLATITHGGSSGIALVVALLAALWSASSGTQNLMNAVNVAYDETETRNVLRLRGTALALTLGAVVFVVVTVALVAVTPILLDGLPLVGRLLAQVVRWALLLGLVTVALAFVYRFAPSRDAPRFRWVSPGAVVATVVWLLGSVAFSLYMDNFGNYNATYGTLAGVVVLMLWLYLTAYIVLLGAEINAEAELQTARDTTSGPAEPIGSRGAVKADATPEEHPHRTT
ncbi:membrane protein [Pseudonocardia ammonioxydans]|uniref:Membrane protein n=1 Tax=Pseudonocardia ammonioxydans TaxID=260086 RepID=A0A1I4XMV6_PSUAM|nr:YihY/virulence factor BrkB family protein [Pseudonocardia ammonioxydans]SFN27174.1 membrane protein [Pseudonocardia ammonioxydans]